MGLIVLAAGNAEVVYESLRTSYRVERELWRRMQEPVAGPDLTDLPSYEPFAKFLAREYPYLDRDDAIQVAMIAAWEAMERWQPGAGADKREWILKRMKWAVQTMARKSTPGVAPLFLP